MKEPLANLKWFLAAHPAVLEKRHKRFCGSHRNRRCIGLFVRGAARAEGNIKHYCSAVSVFSSLSVRYTTLCGRILWSFILGGTAIRVKFSMKWRKVLQRPRNVPKLVMIHGSSKSQIAIRTKHCHLQLYRASNGLNIVYWIGMKKIFLGFVVVSASTRRRSTWRKFSMWFNNDFEKLMLSSMYIGLKCHLTVPSITLVTPRNVLRASDP